MKCNLIWCFICILGKSKTEFNSGIVLNVFVENKIEKCYLIIFNWLWTEKKTSAQTWNKYLTPSSHITLKWFRIWLLNVTTKWSCLFSSVLSFRCACQLRGLELNHLTIFYVYLNNDTELENVLHINFNADKHIHLALNSHLTLAH